MDIVMVSNILQFLPNIRRYRRVSHTWNLAIEDLEIDMLKNRTPIQYSRFLLNVLAIRNQWNSFRYICNSILASNQSFFGYPSYLHFDRSWLLRLCIIFNKINMLNFLLPRIGMDNDDFVLHNHVAQLRNKHNKLAVSRNMLVYLKRNSNVSIHTDIVTLELLENLQDIPLTDRHSDIVHLFTDTDFQGYDYSYTVSLLQLK